MNPMNGPGGASALWQEARNADGRAYYYNVQTKATQWTKPIELMTPVEVRIPVVTYPVNEHCANQLYLLRIARPSGSALERIYSGWWAQILVQHGKQTKHVGDARGLQECARTGSSSSSHASCVSYFLVFYSAMTNPFQRTFFRCRWLQLLSPA